MASDLQAAETQLASAQEQLKQRNLELQEESREKVDLMDRVSTLEQERQQKLQEVVNLNQQLEHLQAENRQHEQTILQLQSQATSTDTDTDEPNSTTPQHFAQEDGVSAKEVAALQDRLSSFEHTLNRLQQENAQLRTDLRDLKDHQHTTTNTGNTSAPVAPSTPEEPEDLQIETKKTVLYDKIIVPDREQDDLTRIEGIGDFIAKKLNSNGIFTYAEIASWTPDRIKTVTEAIGYIPGRIEKDNWVGQAALLLQQQMDGTVIPTPAEARSVVVEDSQKDAAPAGMTEDYTLTRGRSVQVFWAQSQTNLLSIDSNSIRSLNRLPDTLDLNRNTFGLGFELSQVDYRNNPRRGWEWQLQFGAGRKTIRRNNEIEAIGLEGLYDSLTLRSAQYQVQTQVSWYLPLGQRGVVKTGFQGAAIIADEPVLANEQIRIGGNRLLRGFDEESIFATNFGLATLEYRFLLSTDSYLYAFYDYARVDNRSLNNSGGSDTVLWYQGLGAGITFETRAGLFGLSLAFGKQEGLTFDFG
eukprot:g500.t1